MNYSPDIPMEALRAVLTIAGWWVLFYLRQKPAYLWRRVVLLASFPVCYIVWRVLSLSPSTGNQLRWNIIILLFALLCGNWRESLFTAVYYIGMESCLDTIRNFIVRYTYGGGLPRYSPGYNLEFNLLYLAVLGWALFYYWVMKNRRGQLPLRFWIMVLVAPLGSMALFTYYSETAARLMAAGVNIYLEGLLFAFLLFALNLFTFYIYVRLLAYYESYLQARVLQEQITADAHRITVIEGFQRQAGEMRHEFKNLLFTLKIDMQQQNYGGVNNRISALLGDMKQAETESYTGNALVDAMISYRAARLRSLGAVFSVQADPLDIEPSDAAFSGALAYDIASIMGISLENAAEAVAALAAGGILRAAGPVVNCVIQRRKNMLLIDVTNPLPAPLRCKNGEIQSTKAESGHGLGLSALRHIVRKYTGDVVISDSDGVFSLSVTLYTKPM
jgi:signal transduction histidine kinase